MRPVRSLWLVFTMLLLAACHGRPVRAPYAKGDAPSLERLLQSSAARYSATVVSKAKIREGRKPGARLLLRAEAPARLLGTVEVAGNPLVQLAMHEEGYALRILSARGGSEPGFYEGPADPCAVRAILGVDLPPEQMVDLVLGGGPVIAGPHQLVGQKWVKRPGVERVVIENGRERQQIDFAWVADDWWYAGSKLWRLDGDKARWMWTIEHESLEAKGKAVAPAKTHVRTPDGKGGSIELNLSYQKRSVTPLGERATEPEDDGGDDGFDDDGGWESEGDEPSDEWDDEGWEDGETPAPHDAPPAETSPIPAMYRLDAGGLPNRGPLCR